MTTEQLRIEVERLRHTLRTRAVAEQATGLLAGRMRCGINAARTHLNQLAQSMDLPLMETASLLLADDGTSTQLWPDAIRGVEALHDLPQFRREAFLRKGEEAPTDSLVDTEPARTAATATGLLGVLDTIPVPISVVTPVRDDQGRVYDFRVDCHNAAAAEASGRSSDDSRGRTLKDDFPTAADNGLFDGLVQVLTTGEPLKLDLFAYQMFQRGKSRPVSADIHACVLGDALMVCWQLHDAMADSTSRLHLTERLGHIGWAEWNLFSDQVLWSEQVYLMHNRAPADGPIPLDEYPRYVHHEDLPVVETLLRAVMDQADGQAEVEFRLALPNTDRHIRVIAEALLDPAGAPTVVRGVFQDVTARRVAEQRLAVSRVQVERQRREETLNVQRALLPAEARSQRFGRYAVAVRYLPSRSGNKIGGDWHEVSKLPDGRAVVGIGDMAGHGLSAAAGMARLGNALRGLAVTGQEPDQLLRWLNGLVWGREAEECVASVSIGYLDPKQPRLTWAQAGHPRPVLVRDGAAHLLEPPPGALLGASDAPDYRTAVEPLESGDLLLFYTDGLVEQRQMPIDDGIDKLLRVAADCGGADPEEAIERLFEALGVSEREDDVCLLAVQVV